jgi:hypothetical protein
MRRKACIIHILSQPDLRRPKCRRHRMLPHASDFALYLWRVVFFVGLDCTHLVTLYEDYGLSSLLLSACHVHTCNVQNTSLYNKFL